MDWNTIVFIIAMLSLAVLIIWTASIVYGIIGGDRCIYVHHRSRDCSGVIHGTFANNSM